MAYKQAPPEYWRNLGSSKTRTKEQEIKGRDLILQKITETTENTAIACTDGSCLNNPGPCGAGAIIFVEEETSELKQPVCKRGSILLGELIAIKIVIEYIDQPEIRRKIKFVCLESHEGFLFYLMMEIVVESSSITEIPSVLQ
jgi:hypothetical protein